MRAVAMMTSPSWTPADPDERRIGRILHAYLSTMTVPDSWWDGTPAGIAEQLYELVEACEELAMLYRRTGSGGALTVQTDTIADAALLTAHRWCGDHRPLPIGPARRHDLRSAAVAVDLAHFGDLAHRVLQSLAVGGGWATELGLQPGVDVPAQAGPVHR